MVTTTLMPIQPIRCLGCEHVQNIWEETCYICGRAYDCDELTLDTIEGKWVCDNCLNITFRRLVLIHWGETLRIKLCQWYQWVKRNACILTVTAAIFTVEFSVDNHFHYLTRHFVVAALAWALVRIVKHRES